MTLIDRIKSTSLWQSGEPFTAREMGITLGVGRTQITGSLQQMADEVSICERGEFNGRPVFVYSKKADARPWLTMRWTRGQFDPGTFYPGEWV